MIYYNRVNHPESTGRNKDMHVESWMESYDQYHAQHFYWDEGTVGDAISGFSPGKAAAAVEKYSLGMIPIRIRRSRIANRVHSP
jgi:hypothetical protein